MLGQEGEKLFVTCNALVVGAARQKAAVCIQTWWQALSKQVAHVALCIHRRKEMPPQCPANGFDTARSVCATNPNIFDAMHCEALIAHLTERAGVEKSR